MQKIAVTGCASRFAKVLLPLLDNDPDIEQIIGVDLAAPTATYNKTHFTSQGARKIRLQLVHEDDLASAFHAMVQNDLPGAFNVVGDDPDSLPNIAAAAGLQVVEIPGEMLLQAVTSSWESGTSAFGPEWLGEGTLICSNVKLKATGKWTPRYTTTGAFIETVKAVV